MAGTSLLALIDDIATLLDDVTVFSKVAAGKAAGVLGDDLALNAEQVSGVRAERELPVVFAVAKGALLNKCILVPAALAINALLPILSTILLMLGGAYLCFEGFEKLAHRFLHKKGVRDEERKKRIEAVADKKVNLVEFEKNKIKGAIRTDFILSAEIIVITLGVVKGATFITQLAVLSSIALVVTVAVYGIVAAIVKLDDVGLYLAELKDSVSLSGLKQGLGRGLLAFAPILMKTLSVVGTAAMFLVGGGILLHGMPGGDVLLQFSEAVTGGLPYVGNVFSSVSEMLLGAAVGVTVGALLVSIAMLGKKLYKAKA